MTKLYDLKQAWWLSRLPAKHGGVWEQSEFQTTWKLGMIEKRTCMKQV